MNKDTVQKYNVDLQELGLLRLLSNGVKLTPDNLLLSNPNSIERTYTTHP